MRTPTMMRMLILIVAALGLLFGGGRLARAGIILDQSFDPGANADLSAGVGFFTERAQTFTVAIGGTMARIDVLIEEFRPFFTGALTIDVRPTVGGIPVEDNSLALFTTTVPTGTAPPAGSPAFFSVDVSSAQITVTPGEVLAITMRTNNDGGRYQWIGHTANPYPGGVAYVRDVGFGWTPEIINGTTYDLGFREFVNTPVPEPSGVTLLCLGAVVLAGRIRWWHGFRATCA